MNDYDANVVFAGKLCRTKLPHVLDRAASAVELAKLRQRIHDNQPA
jgi:hypothetical protein